MAPAGGAASRRSEPAGQLDDAHYQKLLVARTALRRFLRWSEERAQGAGMTPAQHQLLVAIRGHGGQMSPTIGDVADSLLLRHHSAVGLVQRAEAAGLVRRMVDKEDRRLVRLDLTPKGRKALGSIATQSVEELRRLHAALNPMVEGI
ncbi:MAG: MarR family winged helix-turn-helix transcriptional regulator [Acidimicrobiales bacterium]